MPSLVLSRVGRSGERGAVSAVACRTFSVKLRYRALTSHWTTPPELQLLAFELRRLVSLFCRYVGDLSSCTYVSHNYGGGCSKARIRENSEGFLRFDPSVQNAVARYPGIWSAVAPPTLSGKACQVSLFPLVYEAEAPLQKAICLFLSLTVIRLLTIIAHARLLAIDR